MTQSITRHLCGICKEEYEHLEAAQACEAKGVAVSYVKGTIFKNKDDAAPRVWAVCQDRAAEHMHVNPFDVWVMYAKPGPGCPDVVPGKGWGAAHMGSYLPGRLGAFDAVLEPNDVALLRMVAALTAAGVAPLVWTGIEALPYLDWLALMNELEQRTKEGNKRANNNTGG